MNLDLRAYLSAWLNGQGAGVFSRTGRGEAGLAPTGQRRLKVVRWTILAATTLLLGVLFPRGRTYEFSKFREGAISEERVVAEFEFPIYKRPWELEREQEAVRRQVPPLLRYDGTVGRERTTAMEAFFREVALMAAQGVPDSLAISRLTRADRLIFGQTIGLILGLDEGSREELASTCQEVLSGVYRAGVAADRRAIAAQSHDGFAELIDEGRIRRVAIGGVKDLSAAKEEAADALRRSLARNGSVKAGQEVVGAFLSPNLFFDREGTEARRDSAAANVAPIKGVVFKDEKIVDANEKVTAEQMEKLDSYARARVERELGGNPWRAYLLFAEQMVISAFLMIVLFMYLAVFERETCDRISRVLLCSLLVLLPASIASYLGSHAHLEALEPLFSPFSVPVALCAMLATILLSPQTGFVIAFVSALLTGAIFHYDFQLTLVCALCAAVAVHAVRRVTHRRHFYRAVVYLPLAYSVAIVATNALRYPSADKALDGVVSGLLNGFFSPILTIGLLPILETVFGITTDITLLELSDLNRPLLRDLAIRAPGTYSHTIVMARLSEAAAEAVGSDPLLARVACYYHDIGKMIRPKHFIENLKIGDRNPHDKLTPTMSALIIAAHVKDGLELAREHRLPTVISDIIPQHHGTSLMEYFHNKALERGGKGGVHEEHFRYPGPKPQTKAAGIIMLADAVEAATRSLKERSPGRIKELVRHVIQRKFEEGELDECDLTLKDLSRIEDSFLPVLVGTMHARVEYPWQKEKVVHRQPSTEAVSDQR